MKKALCFPSNVGQTSKIFRASPNLKHVFVKSRHPSLQVADGKLLNYNRTEDAHKVRKKTFIFYYVAVKCKLLGEQNRYGLVWTKGYSDVNNFYYLDNAFIRIFVF